MDGQKWLDEVRRIYRRNKEKCERAADQISDRDFFSALQGHPMSVALQMKHLGGNHQSRWRDFLSRDGEKRDRDRDREFLSEGEDRDQIYEIWNRGWRTALDGLDGLQASDLDRTITIRGEPHSVFLAIQRNLDHTSYHVGQIVLLARHFAGDRWEFLSIPPGKSEEFNRGMMDKFHDWWAAEEESNS